MRNFVLSFSCTHATHILPYRLTYTHGLSSTTRVALQPPNYCTGTDKSYSCIISAQ